MYKTICLLRDLNFNLKNPLNSLESREGFYFAVISLLTIEKHGPLLEHTFFLITN